MGEDLNSSFAQNIRAAKEKFNESYSKCKEILFDVKVDCLMYRVFRHSWLGHVVILALRDTYSTLESTCAYYNISFRITRCHHKQSSYFKLKLNDVKFAEGYFPSRDDAKKFLSQMTMQHLQEYCFTLIPKNDFRVITKKTLAENFRFGSNDVAEKAGGNQASLVQADVPRDRDVELENIINILNIFTNKMELRRLSFEGFSQEEMQEIVEIAKIYPVHMEVTTLKLIVSNRINRVDIVRKLLQSEMSVGGYFLQIPYRYHRFWFNNN